MGRDKKNERRVEHFTKMVRKTMEEPAWQALSPVAQALYPWLKLEWHGPDHNNNGKIRLSVRQASERLGVSHNTAARAFHELQAKGFLFVTVMPSLGSSGSAKATAYELTEIGLPHGDKRGGRQLYKEWAIGADFPVHRARPNNPLGANGKTKPHHQIEDSTVIEFETVGKKASSK
jgi:hypothetical protein